VASLLDRDVAGLVCVGFQGTSPSLEVVDLIRRGVFGVILFARNVAEAEEVTQLAGVILLVALLLLLELGLLLLLFLLLALLLLLLLGLLALPLLLLALLLLLLFSLLALLLPLRRRC
jgi:hypothetical protein